MRKTMSKKSVIASFVAIMASVVLLFGATQISSAKAQETVTPVATWTLKAADGSGYNDPGQTNRKVKEICGATLTVSDMMFWDSATNVHVNRADAPSGYPICSVSTNGAGASPHDYFRRIRALVERRGRFVEIDRRSGICAFNYG